MFELQTSTTRALSGIASLAMTALLVAAPASAAQASNPAANVVASVAESAPSTADTAQPAKRYCVKNTTIGTNIERKVCQTRDAWLAQGFDPLEGR